jgi:glycosyltransferase involved in cell wall biosynthesis
MGNAYYMAKALQDQGLELDFVGPLSNPGNLAARLRELYYTRVRKKRFLRYAEQSSLRQLADEVSRLLEGRRFDVVLSNMARNVALLDTAAPMVTWRDATFAGALEIHRDFHHTAAVSIAAGHAMERAALQRCRLSIFRSQWAARSAIDYYGADPQRVAVIPTGGNREPPGTAQEVRSWIAERSDAVCKLLFVGVQWKGKGGPLAVDVARELAAAGRRVELTIVGCTPELDGPAPDFVKVVGYLNVGTSEGAATLARLWRESHFLLLPTTVDTYGNVFPESNAFGVPCLTTDLAGIPSIIRDDVNGRMFAAEAPAGEYCRVIEHYMAHPNAYREFALSAFNEYDTRLSWTVAGRHAKQLLEGLR